MMCRKIKGSISLCDIKIVHYFFDIWPKIKSDHINMHFFFFSYSIFVLSSIMTAIFHFLPHVSLHIVWQQMIYNLLFRAYCISCNHVQDSGLVDVWLGLHSMHSLAFWTRSSYSLSVVSKYLLCAMKIPAVFVPENINQVNWTTNINYC